MAAWKAAPHGAVRLAASLISIPGCAVYCPWRHLPLNETRNFG